jgi:predicted NBD/HSP70 family sugar kinase
MLYAGVDVSKDKVSVAVLTSGGTKLTSGEFDITTEGLRLLELTLKHLKDEISMFIEQTGTYSMPANSIPDGKGGRVKDLLSGWSEFQQVYKA